MNVYIERRKELAKLPPDIDHLYEIGWGDTAHKLKLAAAELERVCTFFPAGTTGYGAKVWATSCGEHWTHYYNAKFCPFCGGIIKFSDCVKEDADEDVRTLS